MTCAFWPRCLFACCQTTWALPSTPLAAETAVDNVALTAMAPAAFGARHLRAHPRQRIAINALRRARCVLFAQINAGFYRQTVSRPANMAPQMRHHYLGSGTRHARGHEVNGVSRTGVVLLRRPIEAPGEKRQEIRCMPPSVSPPVAMDAS